MKTENIFIKAVLSVATVMAVFALPCIAEEEEKRAWTLDAATGFYSDYMFRGFNLYDGMSIQPSLTGGYDTGYGTLGGSLWMHLSAEGDRQEEKFTELDETITYSYSFDPVTLKVGNVWYTYPKDSDGIENSAEVFLVATIDDSGFNPFSLTPIISVYHDYDEYDTQYYELGLSHATSVSALGEGFQFTPYVAFGFGSNVEKVYADDGLVQVTFGASTNLNWGDVIVTPSLNYTREADDNTVSEFWMGTVLTYSF